MNGVTYVALEVESYERGELDICDRAGLKKHGLWLITHGGIVKVSGEVIEVNSAAIAGPEVVNQAPYDAGWMLKIRLADPSEISGLLTAADYDALTK